MDVVGMDGVAIRGGKVAIVTPGAHVMDRGGQHRHGRVVIVILLELMWSGGRDGRPRVMVVLVTWLLVRVQTGILRGRPGQLQVVVLNVGVMVVLVTWMLVRVQTGILRGRPGQLQVVVLNVGVNRDNLDVNLCLGILFLLDVLGNSRASGVLADGCHDNVPSLRNVLTVVVKVRFALRGVRAVLMPGGMARSGRLLFGGVYRP